MYVVTNISLPVFMVLSNISKERSKIRSMKEDKFFEMCDIMEEEAEMAYDKYFPTVDEIKSHNVEQNLEKYLPMLLYFSNDPFEKEGIELDENEQDAYYEMIDYVNELIKHNLVLD